MAEVAPALARFLSEFRRVSAVFVDSYFVVDADRRLVEWNRAFHAMLPRAVARNLAGKHCHEVLELNICAKDCIAKRCWSEARQVRLDEITGTIPGDADAGRLRFIVSAVPILDDDGTPVGALEVHRNVTGEAVVQVKYQEMLETEARERERLAGQIRLRTRELLDTSELLLRTQRELLAYKKGLTL